MTAHRILSWTPSAIVFDCDGTLMDTECHWQEARARVLHAQGLELTPDFAERAKGLHYTQCGRMMAEDAGRPLLAEKMTDQLLEHFKKLAVENPLTMPGAVELVLAAHRFAPLAVASNCPAEVVEFCLGGAGLLDYFGHIVVPDDTVRPKPDPDVYLTAARLCGAAPADTLAVEDSRCGIEAAARAGMRVLGTGPRPEEEVLGLVDMWVPALTEPRLTAWAEERPMMLSGPGT